MPRFKVSKVLAPRVVLNTDPVLFSEEDLDVARTVIGRRASRTLQRANVRHARAMARQQRPTNRVVVRRAKRLNLKAFDGALVYALTSKRVPAEVRAYARKLSAGMPLVQLSATFDRARHRARTIQPTGSIDHLAYRAWQSGTPAAQRLAARVLRVRCNTARCTQCYPVERVSPYMAARLPATDPRRFGAYRPAVHRCTAGLPRYRNEPEVIGQNMPTLCMACMRPAPTATLHGGVCLNCSGRRVPARNRREAGWRETYQRFLALPAEMRASWIREIPGRGAASSIYTAQNAIRDLIDAGVTPAEITRDWSQTPILPYPVSDTPTVAPDRDAAIAELIALQSVRLNSLTAEVRADLCRMSGFPVGSAGEAAMLASLRLTLHSYPDQELFAALKHARRVG